MNKKLNDKSIFVKICNQGCCKFFRAKRLIINEIQSAKQSKK